MQLAFPYHIDARDRTAAYWHATVPGLRAGQHYAYRVRGPRAPAAGERFDDGKALLDPYGRAVSTARYDRAAVAAPGPALGAGPRSVVADLDAYDWEGDQPLGRPFGRTVVYELHVRGFTRDPSSGVSAERRGTYLGLVEKIPYLRELGVTAVELLPVFDIADEHFLVDKGLSNFWG